MAEPIVADLFLFPERKPSAVFSNDGRFRYLLRWPTGIDNDRVLLVIGANPSKAGQVVMGVMRSDPTVSRMRGLAGELGYGWLWMANCRGFVATDPKDVPPDPEAIGPDNFRWLAECCENSDLVLCAWGTLGRDIGLRAFRVVVDSGKVPHALALTKSGEPRHPRGIPKTARPFPMISQMAKEANR